MKSGLEGRNNPMTSAFTQSAIGVSMKSGLEGRNNRVVVMALTPPKKEVSMKSGLEGRNNLEQEVDFD